MKANKENKSNAVKKEMTLFAKKVCKQYDAICKIIEACIISVQLKTNIERAAGCLVYRTFYLEKVSSIFQLSSYTRGMGPTFMMGMENNCTLFLNLIMFLHFVNPIYNSSRQN